MTIGHRAWPSANHSPNESSSSKAPGTNTVKTVFVPVCVPNPRWERCSCQTEGPKTLRPAAGLRGRTSPELLCLVTKWGSLISFRRVADLLKVLLPVGESTNHDTLREHQQAIAERIETDLGEERPSIDFECREEQGEHLLADGPTPMGIDGGYVRAAQKQAVLK